MARYYNLTLSASAGTGTVFCRVAECNASGTPSGENGGNSNRNYTEITYYPDGEVGSGTAGFKLRTQSGQESPMLNMDNVIELDGSAHGQTSTYNLYLAVDGLMTA